MYAIYITQQGMSNTCMRTCIHITFSPVVTIQSGPPILCFPDSPECVTDYWFTPQCRATLQDTRQQSHSLTCPVLLEARKRSVAEEEQRSKGESLHECIIYEENFIHCPFLHKQNSHPQIKKKII